MINSVTQVGRLTKDPELEFTPNGTAVAKFGIAINDKYKDTEKTYFFNLIVYGKLAEVCGDYIHKGSLVAYEGKLIQRSWDSDSGKRSVVEIVVNNIQFLDKKGE